MNKIIVNVLFIGACVFSCMSIRATLEQEIRQVIAEMDSARSLLDCCSAYIRGFACAQEAELLESESNIQSLIQALVTTFKSRVAAIGGKEEVAPGSWFEAIQRESDPAKIVRIIQGTGVDESSLPQLFSEAAYRPSFVWRNRYPLVIMAFIAVSYGIYEYCRCDDEPSFDEQCAKNMRRKKQKINKINKNEEVIDHE